MKSRLIIVFLLLSLMLGNSCQKNTVQQPDPKVQKLEREVARLDQENQKLQQDIHDLQVKLESHIDLQTQASVPAKEQKPEMTIEKLKHEIAPALRDAIAKNKKAMETPKKGSQFGMRMEYNVPAAIYGLVVTDDSEIPYRAKVIVKYEKFLESDKKSDSYGAGSTTFLFAFRKNRWVLENQQ